MILKRTCIKNIQGVDILNPARISCAKGVFYKGIGHGVALMLVLWVLILLDLIVLQFATTMRSEVEITRNFKDRLAAYYTAWGAMEVAKYELQYVGSVNRKGLGSDNIDFRAGARQDDVESLWPRRIELDNCEAEYKITSREGEYDLNFLAGNQGKLEKLLEESGVEPMSSEMTMIARSIIDWVDKDDLYSVPGVGAEDDWYEDNPHPNGMRYECKDDFFYTRDELDLIRGLRPEEGDTEEDIKHKEDILYNFKKYFSERPFLSRNSRINVNIAPYEVLVTEFGDEEAERITEQIKDGQIPRPGLMINSCEVEVTGWKKEDNANEGYDDTEEPVDRDKGQRAVEVKLCAGFDIRLRNRIRILYFVDNYLSQEERPAEEDEAEEVYDTE